MLGFPFFYELLTRSIDIRILEDDDPHILGALMLQMLPEREATTDTLLTSILRAIAFNPHVADRMMRFGFSRLCCCGVADKMMRFALSRLCCCGVADRMMRFALSRLCCCGVADRMMWFGLCYNHYIV